MQERRGVKFWEILIKLTCWEEVSSILGIIASTVEFSYKLVDISHGLKGPDRVCGCGSAI